MDRKNENIFAKKKKKMDRKHEKINEESGSNKMENAAQTPEQPKTKKTKQQPRQQKQQKEQQNAAQTAATSHVSRLKHTPLQVASTCAVSVCVFFFHRDCALTAKIQPAVRGLHRERVGASPTTLPPLLPATENSSEAQPHLLWRGRVGTKEKQLETLTDECAHHWKVSMRVCVLYTVRVTFSLPRQARKCIATVGTPDSPYHSVHSELHNNTSKAAKTAAKTTQTAATTPAKQQKQQEKQHKQQQKEQHKQQQKLHKPQQISKIPKSSSKSSTKSSKRSNTNSSNSSTNSRVFLKCRSPRKCMFSGHRVRAPPKGAPKSWRRNQPLDVAQTLLLCCCRCCLAAAWLLLLLLF